MGTGTGFGKTILIGDQFVLRGVPAIVAALPFETECTVERIDGDGWVLQDDRHEVPGYKEKKQHQQVESINRVLEVMGVDAARTPIKITYGGSLLAGSGVGASAASCVSLARALNDEFVLGLSIEEINLVGWEGEFAYHGIPSGVDNTASTYGGPAAVPGRRRRKVVREDRDRAAHPHRACQQRRYRGHLDPRCIRALDQGTGPRGVCGDHEHDQRSVPGHAVGARAERPGDGGVADDRQPLHPDRHGLSHEILVALCDRALALRRPRRQGHRGWPRRLHVGPDPG